MNARSSGGATGLSAPALASARRGSGADGIESRPADDTDLLLEVMPPHILRAVRSGGLREQLIEIVLDLGRLPEARYASKLAYVSDVPVSREDIEYVISRVGTFTEDNRAGIERTLHRISAIRNRRSDIIGLTCRVGRAIFGTVDIVRDVIEQGASLLLLGRPGVGKTTLLRESARVLADEFGKRVVIVDTSNEIGGDGDIPHPGIGRARRMQVPTPDRQHAVMIEAVENHMPEAVVIDEIGTQAEASAARTIAERGVQLIATAHGNTLDNLTQNPTLSDLIGGIQAVTLSDEEARRRRTQKTVLERKAPPTFQVLVEIQEKDRLAIHSPLARVVDDFLKGASLEPEIRVRTADGQVEVEQEAGTPLLASPEAQPAAGTDLASLAPRHRQLRIFTYGVNRDRLERAIKKLRVPAVMVKELELADVILTHKTHEKRRPRKLRDLQASGVPLHIVRNNTLTQMEHFLRSIFLPQDDDKEEEEEAVRAAENAVSQVFESGQPVELLPQNSFLRSLQHQIAERYGLITASQGREPYRRVVIHPL